MIWMNILLAGDYITWDLAVSTSYLFLHCKLEGTELLNRVLVTYITRKSKKLTVN
jgi:hypothetical protein